VTARTTYSDLTNAAAHELARGLHLAQRNAVDPERSEADQHRPDQQWAEHDRAAGRSLLAAMDAHRDLSAALAHLGRVLDLPPGGSGPTGRTARRGTADARLVRDLEERAAARDWTEPIPAEESVPGALWRASRLIRAAADLWTTHHTPGGAPRSPEASRMRHPAVLGAATRQWRDLVEVAGAVADQLVALAAPAESGEPDGQPASGHETDAGVTGRVRQVTDEAVSAVQSYPRPARPAATPVPLVDLPVARPSQPPGGCVDPLTEVVERIDAIHRMVWQLAEAGSAPAPLLANVAAIGMAVAQSAEAAHRRAGALVPPGPTRDCHREAADAALRSRSLWRAVATQVEPLRTPHPATSAVQVQRAELTRALARLTSAPVEGIEPTAEALSRASREYAELADLAQRALRSAHERGEIYLLGRALPNEALTRRPDLLQAKLAGQVVPAPTVVVRRLEAALRAIARDQANASLGGGSSPAA
jgi:hypothetical protein